MGVSRFAQLTAALAEFSGASRLYALTLADESEVISAGELLVEAFAASDTLQEIGARDVIVLSTSAHVAPEPLLGRDAALEITLADGTRTSFGGEVSEVAMLGSDGGLARYRIRISPWTWRLGQVRNSRVWQDKSVIEIVDSVFTAYLPQATWRWSAEAGPFMADAMRRSYCCQYRESDLEFVRRILTEEGCAGASSRRAVTPAWCCLPTAATRKRCRKTPAASVFTGRAPSSIPIACRRSSHGAACTLP